MAAELSPERALSLAGSAIRPVRPEDASAVSEILHHAPEAVFWPEASVKEVLTWTSILAIASERDGKIAGFLIGRQTGEQAEILNLAVAPANRRTGEGGALLKAACESFRSRGVSRVFLEVRESNSLAIAFYEKRGFSRTARRDRYYQDPAEAALVMERQLIA